MSAYQQASTVHCSSERERASTVHRSSECERASMVHRSSECERASTVHQHHDVRLYLLLIRIDSQASLPRPRPRAPRRDVTALSIMKRARGSGAGRWWVMGGRWLSVCASGRNESTNDPPNTSTMRLASADN